MIVGGLIVERFIVRHERLGIFNPSAEYLSGYVDDNKDKDVPAISLECVMAASGLIEKMGRERLKPRKEDQQ